MRSAIFLAAGLVIASTVAAAAWPNWQVNRFLYNRWWSRPVAEFFAVNGPPQMESDTVAGISGLGAQYRWQRGSCFVLIRTQPNGIMAALNSYGPCRGVVR